VMMDLANGKVEKGELADYLEENCEERNAD
jgi:hypothetical protein